jgi:S1-C subfamily serine protease
MCRDLIFGILLCVVLIASVVIVGTTMQPTLDGLRRDLVYLREVTGHQWHALDGLKENVDELKLQEPDIQRMADTAVTVLIKVPCQNPNCSVPFHTGVGSGVLVGQGNVLTAWHLFDDQPEGTEYFVKYNDIEYPVAPEDILLDPDSDLALVSVSLPTHPYAEMSLEDPPLGADIVMIGTPGPPAMSGYVVKGNICHVHAEKVMDVYLKDSAVYQLRWSRLVGTTAFTVHGNSGGPVFYKGKVVGIFVGFPLIEHRFFRTNYTVYVPVYEFNTE